MPNVLVADDSIAVRKVAERLLKEAGLGVTLAANGEEAMAYLAKERPDLIVSDVIMPDKSGYEVCAFVRGQTALADTPVLLISGIVNEEVTKQAESCRADGVLKKPFQGTSLKDRVLELLAQKRAQSSPAPQQVEPKTSASQFVESGQGNDGENETNRPASAKLARMEEELRNERRRAEELTQRLAQLEEQSVRWKTLEAEWAGQQSEQSDRVAAHAEDSAAATRRVQELEEALEMERERSSQLNSQMETLRGQAEKAEELEGLLHQEREQLGNARKEIEELQSQAARVAELDAALQHANQQSSQQAQRIDEMKKSVLRVQELDAALTAERQAATQLVQQMTTMEKAVNRSHELAQTVARERQRADELTKRLAEMESENQKTTEFHQLLDEERERNAVLARRVSEAEQTAERASGRFEELAKKLGEIAGLAAQLGGGEKWS